MNDVNEVVFRREGALGRMVLNRPRALNALTRAMVTAVDGQLQRWADDEAVQAVSLEGAGDRGLCAGGDVVAVRAAIADGAGGQDFFAAEYSMNSTIANYGKPVVAFQDGFVLGGGVGISAHCSLRLATPRTKLAMPETIIGFFPDVGALHLLAAAPGEFGTHLALTGVTVSGADAVHAGMSDAVIDEAEWPTVLESLRQGRAPQYQALPAPSRLAAEQDWMDECYAGDDAAVILERLRSSRAPAAAEAAALIEQRSPWSVAITLEALRRAERMKSVDEVLAQDLRLARAASHHPDFAEGVRAQLVDKDRSPKWTHPDLRAVPRGEVEAAFAG